MIKVKHEKLSTALCSPARCVSAVLHISFHHLKGDVAIKLLEKSVSDNS